ncbi:hypothetical protein Gotri_000864 [Gossypium trilobum]|uniref:Uncharacterized protein n=1 Tax=Gossypium trilobum TaxID=34281 RepID=A0A7J9FCP9_9ROSI|nr:hypothetical protein [Gossypium trilobum]
MCSSSLQRVVNFIMLRIMTLILLKKVIWNILIILIWITLKTI